MYDNFKGWGNFAENVLRITSNVCISHATGNVQLRCVSGIASAHLTHVKQFPDVAAYDDYYDIVVDTGEIGVDQFAKRVQSLLVQYFRARYGDDTANWCERFWTVDIVSFIAGMRAASCLQQQYGRGSELA